MSSESNKCPLCALTGLTAVMRQRFVKIDTDETMWLCPTCWCLMTQKALDDKWLELMNSAKNPDHLARFINIFKAV